MFRETKTIASTSLLPKNMKNHPFFEANPFSLSFLIAIPNTSLKDIKQINTKDIKVEACKLIYKDMKHVWEVNKSLDLEKFKILSINIPDNTSFKACDCNERFCNCVKLADNKTYKINKILSNKEIQTYFDFFTSESAVHIKPILLPQR